MHVIVAPPTTILIGGSRKSPSSVMQKKVSCLQDFLKKFLNRNRDFETKLTKVESKQFSKKSLKRRDQVVYATVSLLQDFAEKLKAKLKAKNLPKIIRHALCLRFRLNRAGDVSLFHVIFFYGIPSLSRILNITNTYCHHFTNLKILLMHLLFNKKSNACNKLISGVLRESSKEKQSTWKYFWIHKTVWAEWIAPKLKQLPTFNQQPHAPTRRHSIQNTSCNRVQAIAGLHTINSDHYSRLQI